MGTRSCPLAPGPRGRLLLMAAAVLAVVVPFMFWNQTWFGREISNEEMTRHLRDDKHPRRIQHALSQMSARIASGDPTASVWFPDVVALARHPVTEIRTTAAWLMGQDNRCEPFHRALLALLRDTELIVRRNAALALVCFRDSSGRAELIGILEPQAIHAPERGRIQFQLAVRRHVGANALLARIEGDRVAGRRKSVRPWRAGCRPCWFETGRGWNRETGCSRWSRNRATRGRRYALCTWWGNPKTPARWTATRAASRTCRTAYAVRLRLPPTLYVLARNVTPIADGPVGFGRQAITPRCFPFLRNHHLDGIPRTPVEEGPIRTLAGTLGASDAGGLIDLNPSCRTADGLHQESRTCKPRPDSRLRTPGNRHNRCTRR